MLKQEKRLLSLVWFDFFALWICPVLIAVFNGVLNTACIWLFGYSIGENLICPLLFSVFFGILVKEVSNETVHLRNSSAELRLYVWNWMKIALIANVGVVLVHYLLLLSLPLPLFGLPPDAQKSYNDVFVLLFSVTLVSAMASRTFLVPDLTDASHDPNRPTVLRGGGLSSGRSVSSKAWRGRK